MADHAELVNELPEVEKMTTQERLKHARKRRAQQLKKWSQRERDHSKDVGTKKKKTDQNLHKKSRRNDFKVHFVPGVMLLEAAARGDIEEVRRLLIERVNPNSTNEDGLTAIHQCCIDNNEEMMKLLIEYGANVNAEDSEKWTPLHAAATCGHLNLVKYLISKQANLLAVNADGNMPYDICDDEKTLDFIESEMAKRGVTQELIENTRTESERIMLSDLKWIASQKGDLEYRDSNGATPLHIASANGYLSVVKFLLDQNVSMDAVDADLWQPIHAAACWGQLEVLELLVKHGANLDAKTKNGETPFDICEDLEMKDKMVQLKDELDYKKSSETQRPRRTHSQNNTRSQSVRRTSIRDKTRMSQEEAKGEAKPIFQAVDSENEKLQSDNETSEKHSSKSSSDRLNSNNPKEALNNVIVDTYARELNSVPRPVEVINSVCVENVENRVNINNSSSIKTTEKSSEDKRSNHEKSSSKLINVPVISVSSSSYTISQSSHAASHDATTNGGGNTNTLSDLKRQRNVLRKQNSTSEISVPEKKMNGHGPSSDTGDSTKYNTNGGSSTSSGAMSNGSVAMEFTNRPSSPSITIRKFTGLTADDMGPKQKYNCCIIL